MIVRPIRLEDAEQFVQLVLRIDASGLMEYEPGERKTSKDLKEQKIESILFQRNSTILVAEVNERLIGYVIAEGNQLKRRAHSAKLTCGIIDEFRSKGICTLLFDEIMNWAKDVGITRLETSIAEINSNALDLFQKVGFQIEGKKIRSFYMNGELVDEILLAKLI